MAMVRGKLEFQNVVGMRARCTYGEWQESAMELRAFLIQNDIYITGPVLIKWDNVDEETKQADVTIYLPTYQKLNMENNDMFFFCETLLIKDGLKIRHPDLDNEIQGTELLLETVAEQSNITLQKPYIYIYLPVFQEYVIDIYAPISEEEGKNE